MKRVAVWRRWVHLEEQGGWSFMSYCKFGAFVNDTACEQPYTTVGKNVIGSQLAVSPSYQMTYGSVSWQSTGSWQGVTFQRQLARMLQVSA